MFGSSSTRPLFSIAGVPVSVSPWHFALLGFIFYELFKQSIALGVGVVIIGSFSVLMHEFGHAMVSKWFGLRPQIALVGLGGVTHHAPARSPRDEFLLTAAGPAVNFVLALFFYVVAPESDSLLPTVLRYGMWVNVIWGVFNLVPVFPLDGGILLLVVLRVFLPRGGQAERVVYGLGLGISVLGGLWALSSGQLLLLYILAMTGMNNWRMLQAVGASPVVHETKAHAPVRDLLVQARRAYESADFETAIRFCHQARSEPFLSVEEMRHVWHILSLSSARSGQYEDAIRFAERLQGSSEMAQVRAVCILALKDSDKARDLLTSGDAALISGSENEALVELIRQAEGARN